MTARKLELDLALVRYKFLNGQVGPWVSGLRSVDFGTQTKALMAGTIDSFN